MDETRETRWFVGIDGARDGYQICVLDAAGHVVTERMVAHTGTGLMEFGDWLATRTAGGLDQVAVAIEVPRGPVIEMLLERGGAVYAVNPKQLDRFRDRHSIAGAKDDRRDAFVLADALRTDQRHFRRLAPESDTVIELRTWSRLTKELQDERTRVANRLTEHLWRYYPQALTVTDDVGAPWFLELLGIAATPLAAARLRRPRVAALLAHHRIRRVDAPTVLAALRAPAPPVAPGTVTAAAGAVGVLCTQLRLLNEQLGQCRAALDRLLEAGGANDPAQRGEQRDVVILRSLPGVGRIVLATLLAEAAEPLRTRDYHGLRLLSGAAPVTRQSGKRRRVAMRRACQPRLRDALFHWSGIAAQCDPATKAAYTNLRRRGHSHGRALRSIGDRLLAVACAMLRDGTVYDPARRRPAAA